MAPENIHGRKWGRGIRPWLLIPKYLCVAMLLGGLLAIGTLALMPVASADAGRQVGNAMSRILWYQIFPGAGGATLFGVLLFLQHPATFARMRWLWTKLAIVAAGGALAHLLLKGQIATQQMSPPGHVMAAALITLAVFLLAAIVGRLKPRLWQKFTTR